MRVVLLHMTVALQLMPVILETKEYTYQDQISMYLSSKFGLQVQVIIGASDAPESATCYAQSQTEARLT
jgi:hypothetical protein